MMRFFKNLLYDFLILIFIAILSLALSILYFIFVYEGKIDDKNLLISKINQYTPIEIKFTSIEKGSIDVDDNISIKVNDLNIKYRCEKSMISIIADDIDMKLSVKGLYLDVDDSSLKIGKSVVNIIDISNPVAKIEEKKPDNTLSITHDEIDLYLNLVSRASKIKFNIDDADITISSPKYNRHFRVINYNTYHGVVAKNKIKIFKQNVKSSGASFDIVTKKGKSHIDISCVNYKIPQCNTKVENINNIIKSIINIDNISNVNTNIRLYKHVNYIGSEYTFSGKIKTRDIKQEGKFKIGKDDVMTGDINLFINKANSGKISLQKLLIKDNIVSMNANFKVRNIEREDIKAVNYVLMDQISFLVPIIEKAESVEGNIIIDDNNFSLDGKIQNGAISIKEYVPLPKITNISSTIHIDEKRTSLFVNKANMKGNILHNFIIDINYHDEFSIEICTDHKNKISAMDILDDMMEQDKLYTYPNKISSLLIDDDNNSVTINNLYLKIPFIDNVYKMYKKMIIKAKLSIDKPNNDIFIDRMPYYGNPVYVNATKMADSNVISTNITPIGYDLIIKEIPMHIKSNENMKISSEIDINQNLDIKVSAHIKTDKNNYLTSVTSYKQDTKDLDIFAEINVPNNTVAKAQIKMIKKELNADIDVKVADLSNIITILTSQTSEASDDKLIFPFEKINIKAKIHDTKIANGYSINNFTGDVKYKNNKFAINANLEMKDEANKTHIGLISFNDITQEGSINISKLGPILHGLNIINHDDIGSLYGKFSYYNKTNLMFINLKAYDISMNSRDENSFFLLRMFGNILRYTNFNIFSLKKATGNFLLIMDNGDINLIINNISMHNNLMGINSYGTIDASNKYMYISGDVISLYFVTRFFYIGRSNPFSMLKYSINSKIKDVDKNIKFSMFRK